MSESKNAAHNGEEIPPALKKPGMDGPDDKAIKVMEERLAAKREREANKTPEQKAAEAPSVEQAEYAFLVIKKEDGSFAISPNLNMPVTSRRVPTNDDVWQAFHNILKDLQTQQIGQIAGQVAAQAALQTFQQITQQAMGGGLPDGIPDDLKQKLASGRV